MMINSTIQLIIFGLMALGLIACSTGTPIATQYKADRAAAESGDTSTQTEAGTNEETPGEEEQAANEEEAPAEDELTPEEIAAMEAEQAAAALAESVAAGKVIFMDQANNCSNAACHGSADAPTFPNTLNLINNLANVMALDARGPHGAAQDAVFQNAAMAQNILDYLLDVKANQAAALN